MHKCPAKPRGIFLPFSLTQNIFFAITDTMFAIIQTGGKQYLVEPGKIITIEKLEAPENGEVFFDSVLLAETGKGVEVGTPTVPGVVVKGKVQKQGRARKVIVFHKAHQRGRGVKRGHRQAYTKVEIISIGKK
jgi:large subunit ribosomal protein L21